MSPFYDGMPPLLLMHIQVVEAAHFAVSLSSSLSTMQAHQRRKHHLRTATTAVPPPPNIMKEEEEVVVVVEDYNYLLPIPNPFFFFTKFLSFQAEIIYNCLVSVFSPFISIFSLATESLYQAKVAKDRVELAVHAAATAVPSRVAHGSSLLLRRLGLGFLGAAYVGMVLTVVMVLAVILGVGLVQFWVEEPVIVREKLYFDYTDIHPNAVLSFGGGGGGGGFGFGFGGYNKNKKMGVPVGHTFYVSLVLLMPESDFNRDIGVFQLTAELISTNGDVIAKSSQPCMLRFQSLPVRLMRTFLTGIPLILGITSETQKIVIAVLKHKEGKPRTKCIRITLIPRAGTYSLPQIYEAEIFLNSQLPRVKEIVRHWKWTFFVWTSLHMYIMLLAILGCCFRPLIFAKIAANFKRSSTKEVSKEPRDQPRQRAREERDISETLGRWRRSRSKRKAMLLQGYLPEAEGSSASSITIAREDMSATRDDTSTVVGEDDGDAESVHFGGWVDG
ncbi:seipin-1-like [Cornus florida]|uniref:seipin-1-like n=1 Tax=Cornus florida TaxID=4283 RepID=UPI00289EBA37|nr:seipin-1-like [Cornus florida]